MSTLSAWNSRITLGTVEPTIFGLVGPFSPQIMQLKNSEVLVSWRNISAAGDVVSLLQRGQIFSTVGANIVPAFTVIDQAGVAIFSEQGTNLRLSEKQDGGVIGVFKDGDAIKLQEFTAAGAPSVTNQIVVTPEAGSGDVFGPVDVASTSRLSSLVAYGELRSTGSVTTRSTDMFDLFGKIYNPLINAYGSERTLINGPVENFSTHALANGNYLVVAGQASIEIGLFGPLATFNRDEFIVFSLFTSNGSFLKNTEAIALSNDFNESPEVFNDYIATGLDNAGFVVAYHLRSGETTNSFTFLNRFRIYDATGTSFQFGGVPSGEMLAITALPNAEFVIVYRDGVELRAQHFSETGAQLGNFLLDTVQTTLGQGDVEIVGLQDGRFAATWKTTSDLVAFQIFDTRETFDGAIVHPLTFEQIGTVFDDVFTVGAKTTLARGFAGDDTITQLSGTSSAGPASIMGDDGDDTVVMRNRFNTDIIDGGAGVDTIDWSASGELGGVFSLASGTAVGAGGFTQVMTGFENLIGTSSPDVINGTSVANVLSGLGGDDIINGGNGADTINGGADDDHLLGGTGADVINGGTGKDTIDGEIGDDTADYSGSSVGLTVDLLTPSSNTGEAAGDTYVSIENIRGSGLNDTLRGNAGNNIINGGAGTDGMSGRGGDDTYIVDNGGDRVYESTTPTSGIDSGGLDTVFSSVTITLDGYSGIRFVENLTLAAGAGSINGFGNALANVLTGNSGSNTLDGGLGNDTMLGGAGNDIYVVDSASDQVFETTTTTSLIDATGIDIIQSSVTLNLDANAGVRFVERLTLTGTGNINAAGNGLANVLIGNSGNNTLNGGLGIDIMGGGAGDDIYVVDNIGDRLFETTAINTLIDAGGNDTMLSSVSTSIDAYAAVRFIENMTLTGTDNLVAVGNAKDNVLLGNTGNNTLNGGLGADTMGGGLGNDIYVVDNVGDQVFETTTISSGIDTGGVDTIQSSVTQNLDANAGLRFVERLTLTSTANINGTGNALANVMIGNSGNNILDGGVGADLMGGGAGNDTYIVDSASDFVFETTTISILTDAGGTDTIVSSLAMNLDDTVGLRFIENLTLTGTANINAMGNALANVLTGNSGNNTLNGGLGNDILIGGLGADTFVFSTTLGASNIDQITGFSVVDDTIRLEDAIFVGLAPNTLALNAFAANLTGEATDAFDRIIYETDTGALFYDADGVGNLAARVQFATISPNLALTNADFFVF